MIHAAKLPHAAVLVSWLVVACGTKEAPVAVPHIATSDAETGISAEDDAEPQARAPRIAADEAVHDFGAIKATDSIEHVFKIKNVGTADLKIERVQRT